MCLSQASLADPPSRMSCTPSCVSTMSPLCFCCICCESCVSPLLHTLLHMLHVSHFSHLHLVALSCIYCILPLHIMQVLHVCKPDNKSSVYPAPRHQPSRKATGTCIAAHNIHGVSKSRQSLTISLAALPTRPQHRRQRYLSTSSCA